MATRADWEDVAKQAAAQPASAPYRAWVIARTAAIAALTDAEIEAPRGTAKEQLVAEIKAGKATR